MKWKNKIRNLVESKGLKVAQWTGVGMTEFKTAYITGLTLAGAKTFTASNYMNLFNKLKKEI